MTLKTKRPQLEETTACIGQQLRKTRMANDPAGSTWKKWDLHVHTPSSVVHNYPGANQDDAWEAFLQDLESLPPEFKAIGINDYIFIDGYARARKAKLEQGRLRNIDLLLPVIGKRSTNPILPGLATL